MRKLLTSKKDITLLDAISGIMTSDFFLRELQFMLFELVYVELPETTVVE